MNATADPIVYQDTPDYRVLDLGPDGVDCIPALKFSKFNEVHREPGLHYHKGCMEFCLCIGGNLAFETPEGEFPFLPGRIFASSPSEPHHLRSNPKGLKTYTVLFRIPRGGKAILGLGADESRWLSRALTHLPKRLFASTPRVREAFDRLFFVYDGPGRPAAARRAKMKSAALELLISIVEASRRTPERAPGAIRALAARIREKPDADYSITGAARETGLSESSFTRLFKKSEGLPFHQYLINCRIQAARELLLNTDKTVAAVGQSLRFYSTQHFAKAFRRIMGVMPAAYRKSHGVVRRRAPCRGGGLFP